MSFRDGDQTVIKVGERPDALGAEGTYFDGESALAWPVRWRIEESQEVLVIEGAGPAVVWPLRDIRRVPDQASSDGLVLSLAGDPVARLMTDEMALAKRCPNLHRRNTHVKRSRVMGWAMGAVASVALIVFVLVPLMANQLAEFIPPEGEQALGESTLSHIRTALDNTGLEPLAFCEADDGIAALDKMEQRLTAGADLEVPLNVHVLDHEMINAFALPGGHVVFFRGLIEEANTPEELASVFAHEIGHVVSRDPTRHALRSAGSIGVLGLLFGDFAGGAVVLLLAERLIEAQYSQSAEEAADAFAMDMMQDANVAPGALGAMFQTFLEEHGESDGVHVHFQSHPALSARIAASDARQEVADAAGFESQPLLSDAEWQALKQVCR